MMNAITSPPGIRSRFVGNSNGPAVQVLEAGFEGTARPCVVGGHIGYPWTEEAIAMVTKHEKVYIDPSAYTAKRYPPFLSGNARRVFKLPLRCQRGTTNRCTPR